MCFIGANFTELKSISQALVPLLVFSPHPSIRSQIMNNIVSIVLDTIILAFTFIGVSTLAVILFLLVRYRRECPFTAPILLICNNFLAILLCCLFLFEKSTKNLYGNIHSNISMDDWWCYATAYVTSVAFYSLYHSYIIQACFRLFHVVFYKNKKLHSFRFMCLLILIQWSVDLLITIPTLLLHHYEYVPNNYYCSTPFTNLTVLMYIGILEYYIPMISIGSIYFYVLYFMKKTKGTSIQENHRQQSNQRDLSVLRRILILVSMLLMLSFPATVLLVLYVITGYLYPFIYQIQWLSMSLVLLMLPMVTVFLTPQLRELLMRRLRKNRRVLPAVMPPNK